MADLFLFNFFFCLCGEENSRCKHVMTSTGSRSGQNPSELTQLIKFCEIMCFIPDSILFGKFCDSIHVFSITEILRPY